MDMITVSEAAKLANVTGQTVRRWIKQGLLPAKTEKRGFKNYISVSKDEVIKLLDSAGA